MPFDKERIWNLNGITAEQFTITIKPVEKVDHSKWVVAKDMKEWNEAHPYVEDHRKDFTKEQDKLIPWIVDWLKNKGQITLPSSSVRDYS